MEPRIARITRMAETSASIRVIRGRFHLIREFAQGRVPLSLGSQDELHNFTDGALTACGARYVCGTGGHFRSGVGNSDRESDAGKDWKVLHVVSDIAHPVLR